MNKKMQDGFNKQINMELFSAYLYYDMARYFDEEGLDGFAHWMKQQAKEEVSHAVRLYDNVVSRGGHVVLEAIDKPDEKYASPLDIFEKALAHEKMITDSINKLMDLAIKEKDHPSKPILDWFVREQIEEEESVGEVVDKLKLAGEATAGLLFLNSQMSARPQASVTPPPGE